MSRGGFHAVSIGISIGIASSTGAHLTPQRLMQRADEALYAAKGAGRGTFMVSVPDLGGSEAVAAAARV